MRRIKFRGKRIDNGEWIYGWVTSQHKKCTDGDLITTIQSNTFGVGEHSVDTETVGQYTELKECYGKEIYEGDIVAIETGNISVDGDGYFVIKYDTESARFVCEGDGLTVDFDNIWSYCEVEVVGNIHDNPELIGDVEK